MVSWSTYTKHNYLTFQLKQHMRAKARKARIIIIINTLFEIVKNLQFNLYQLKI